VRKPLKHGRLEGSDPIILRSRNRVGQQWLTFAILATCDIEIRKIKVQGQPRQIIHKNPISKITRAKWTGGVVQAVECLQKHEIDMRMGRRDR
jgi:hypothetical protein